jgi:DtxR family Mn-dependent transcriptional regulator
MFEVLINKIVIVLTLVLLLVFLFPRYGLLALIIRSRKASERILEENALKHLFNMEYSNITPTLNSLAASITVSVSRTAGMVQKLVSLKLVKKTGESIHLTAEGRAYALQVIRTHRLWERYLADETNVNEPGWHPRAEKMEHVITKEQARILAAQLGQPLYDPHGDPIPTDSGELPEPIGFPLNELSQGENAVIIHIEDEPASVYTQIVSKGLKIGQKIKITEIKDGIAIIDTADMQVKLTNVMAQNITVSYSVLEFEKTGTVSQTLADLKTGESGVVSSISKRCRGRQRRRLMDLGILPGTIVTAEFNSPSGNLVAYKIREAIIALRKQQAESVLINSNRIKVE